MIKINVSIPNELMIKKGNEKLEQSNKLIIKSLFRFLA